MLTTFDEVHELLGREEWQSDELRVRLQQFRFTGTTLAFDFAQFIYDVVQVVLTIVLSSNSMANMMHGAGHGTNSARSESGESLCQQYAYDASVQVD